MVERKAFQALDRRDADKNPGRNALPSFRIREKTLCAGRRYSSAHPAFCRERTIYDLKSVR
jgi:hypothetical protein